MSDVTLYKRAKTGKIQVYTSWTKGDTLFSEYGELGGAMQESSIVCTGKNIGRTNETTPEEQAIAEGISKCQLKRDKGYFDTIEEAQTQTVFLPMLAKDGQKIKIKYPCDAQMKLDGVRSMAKGTDLMSRGGKPWDVAHISEELKGLRAGNAIALDGELYIHGLSLQKISSLAKKPKPGSENLEYWIYDYYSTVRPTIPWKDRKVYLEQLRQNLTMGTATVLPHIKILRTFRVNSHEEMIKLHNEFVALGYEGIILRTDDGIYELAHRSRNLIKYKQFFDDEYKIVSYKEGIGKFVGCVIWRCITPEGEEFDVTPKGTIAHKQAMYKVASEQIGKDLTVRYWNKTDKGIPAPAVGIVIRDYE